MSKTSDPKGWMGSGSTWSPPLPQALLRCWGTPRRAPPLSISHCIAIQHIALSTADRSSRSLRISAAAISIPSLYKVCFICYSMTLIPAPLTSCRDPSTAGKVAPLEVLITPAQLQHLRSSAWNCILHFQAVSPISQDYFELLP